MIEPVGTLKPLLLLEAVASLQHPASLSELAAELDLPKPTIHRWLASLENLGLLQRTLDGRKYELAKRASDLALSILSNKPAGSVRHEILRRVAADVGEACNLTVLNGTSVTYIDRVETAWPLRITFQQGSTVPAYCSASGKLFLALMPPSKRNSLLDRMSFDPLTENTLTDKSVLMSELGSIRRDGYALDREEYLSGLVCLAVPIHQAKGRTKSCVAALAIQAPVTRMSYHQILTKLPTLQTAAKSLAATLENAK